MFRRARKLAPLQPRGDAAQQRSPRGEASAHRNSEFKLPAEMEESATTTGAARRMTPVLERSSVSEGEERAYSSENPDIRVKAAPVQVNDENDHFAYMLGKRLNRLHKDQAG